VPTQHKYVVCRRHRARYLLPDAAAAAAAAAASAHCFACSLTRCSSRTRGSKTRQPLTELPLGRACRRCVAGNPQQQARQTLPACLPRPAHLLLLISLFLGHNVERISYAAGCNPSQYVLQGERGEGATGGGDRPVDTARRRWRGCSHSAPRAHHPPR
jgi:hypothetical protein